MATESDPKEETLVEPRAGVEPTPAEGGVDLPDDLLQVPAMQGVLSGAPGAFSAIISQFEKDPAAKLIVKNRDPLMRAGVGFYRSLDGQKGVVFNTLHISGDEVKAADQAGQLDAIAPPFAQVNAELAQSGAANPVLNAQVPEGLAMGAGTSGAAPMELESIKPMAASAQKTLASKRANALTPQGPISGASPGSGRLVNAILRPVI